MEDNKKNARIFYLTLAVILAVVVLLIITLAVARRSSPDTNESSTNPTETEDKPTINENELPIFSLPVNGDISYDFSMDMQVFSPTMKDWRTHNGIDFEAHLGSEVFAVADGVVKEIKNDAFMGTSIIIEHEGNAISIYRNLSADIKDGITVGSVVKSGDVIGYVGETASNEIAQEPHLHYELKIDGKHVDPKDHLPIPKNDDSKNDESSDNSDQNSDNQ